MVSNMFRMQTMEAVAAHAITPTFQPENCRRRFSILLSNERVADDLFKVMLEDVCMSGVEDWFDRLLLKVTWKYLKSASRVNLLVQIAQLMALHTGRLRIF